MLKEVLQEVVNSVITFVTGAPMIGYVWLRTAGDKYIGGADNEIITIKVE